MCLPNIIIFIDVYMQNKHIYPYIFMYVSTYLYHINAHLIVINIYALLEYKVHVYEM